MFPLFSKFYLGPDARGNADMIGWQLIGYPGPYMSWSAHIDRHYGEPYRPKQRSLKDVVGHAVKPSEDAE